MENENYKYFLQLVNHIAKFRTREVLVEHIWATFELTVLNVILSHYVQLSRIACNLETPDHRAKLGEISDCGLPLCHI